MDNYIDSIVKPTIAEHGVMLQGVFPHDGDDSTPSFCYTVGLSVRQHPELIAFSLPQQVVATVLNAAAFAVLDDGKTWTPGLTEGLLTVPCHLVTVDDTTEHFSIARRLYPVVRGLQLVWPDTEGRFPWDVGYSGAPHLQPVLGTPSL